ncbi:hypothetical protein KJ707_00665 [Patescibacteria group bacterium]|nr:hypothetical protein [Patescibacteria group bacterium]MBU1967384.1 hypothetical protein [Patescibacteria group bacterium]MBU2543065.1 hypothetical protein [Patescibacteria group bacterium]
MSKINDPQDQKKKQGFWSLGSLFDNYQVGSPGKYISREFQDFGYRLAAELDDLEHKSLYIKLAKNEDRGLLEAARSFVIDADHARSKPRLFMWKLQQLKAGKGP